MNILHNITTWLKLSVRNLLREKIYGLVSILGLAIAMTCTILVYTRVMDDYRYVNYHKNGDRIYRVLLKRQNDSGFSVGDWVPGGITVGFREHFPEVELAARATASFFTKNWIRSGDVTLRQFFCRADPELLDMLDFEFVRGGLETSPGTVVVTESVARRFFKDANPIGKVISRLPGSDYKITGVLKDIPEYAHIRINFLTASTPIKLDKSWNGWSASLTGPKNYVRLREGSDAVEVEKRLNDLMARSVPVDAVKVGSLHLQPMTRAYLYGEAEFGHADQSKMAYLRFLIVIAIVIIVVASVNFINLAAARTLARSREIATRKAVGAKKIDIVLQFLIESMTVSSVAVLLGLALAALLPVSEFTGIRFSWGDLSNPNMIVGIVGIVLFVGLMAGLYPALLASQVQPVEGQRSRKRVRLGGFNVRNILLVTQLGCATFFIVSANVVHNQVHRMANADLGFDQEHIITTRFTFSGAPPGKREVVKEAFNRLPGVISATTIWPGPGAGEKPRRTVIKESDPLNEYTMQILGVDPDFIKTYGMTLLAGRNVGPNFATTNNAEFILNETAVERLGFDLTATPGSDAHPLGQPLRVGSYRGAVIGVMKDFHYRTLHHIIEPMVIFNWSRIALAMRLKPHDVSGTMASIKETWKQFFTQPPSFGFIDRWYNGYYWRQRRQARGFTLLAWTAVFLAGLGVFGLAAYETEQRRREVGIRKVLGASIPSIVTLFWKQHAALVVATNLIALPLAYKAMQAWLQDFAYRIDLTAIPFLIAGIAIGLLFLSVVGTQAARIGRLNPTDTLRSE